METLTEDERRVFELIQTEESEAEKILKLIKDGDVRINCIDKTGMNFLDQAAFKGNEKLVEDLIELGADADNRKHEHGYTCLMFAALAGKPRICEMLLNAGARSYAVNKMGKSVTELAAFVGNFECVSVINSYIGYEDVDRLVHPNGKTSDTIYPKEFVEYIHKLTRTHQIHPLVITGGLLTVPSVLEHRKKLVYIIDRLFEKQLRCKQPNEIMSLKLWIILATFREISNFIDSKLASRPDEDVISVLKQLMRQTAEWKEVDGKIYRQKLESFLSSVIFGFPYKHSVVHMALIRSMKNVTFGKAPSTFVIICATLFGQRLAQVPFCSYCGQTNAIKCCSVCKVLYCSSDCQRSDWPSHKKVCAALKASPELNAYKAPGSGGDETETIVLNEEEEEEEDDTPND